MTTGKGKDKKEWNERKKATVRVYKAKKCWKVNQNFTFSVSL